MKKIIYLLIAFVGITLTSCEPMEDINDQIDAGIDNIEGTLDYTLVADDYTDILELSFPNFSTLDDAKDLIPTVLNEKFPALGSGSAVNVGFDLYNPMSIESYTVSASDYTDAGLNVNYFSATSEIKNFLKMKFPDAKEGDYVKLSYNTIATPIADTLENADYELIGTQLADKYPDPAAGLSYHDFDKRTGKPGYWTDEMIAEALAVYLSDKYDNAVEGELYAVTYDTFTDDYEHVFQTMVLRYDGNAFTKFNSTPDGEAYTFSQDDYSLVATDLADEYPTAAGNLADHGNFYRKYSDNSSYWTDEMLVDAITVVLNNQFPDAADGKVYEVTLDTYGSSSTETFVVVKNGDAYELATSVSITEKTEMFAYTNGSWNHPLTLAKEDYTEMGLSYPDFSNKDDAYYKIPIFLKSHYPYAEEGDFMAVAYDLYESGSGVSTKYANFEYDGNTWNVIPSVISSSLQFGNENGTWVPDNTIRYSLTNADYEMIGAHFADTYPAPATSMAKYHNFEQRGNSSSWNQDMILEAMQYFLQEYAPNAEEGQKYLITYAIYNGTNTTGSIHLIKENGEWKRID